MISISCATISVNLRLIFSICKELHFAVPFAIHLSMYMLEPSDEIEYISALFKNNHNLAVHPFKDFLVTYENVLCLCNDFLFLCFLRRLLHLRIIKIKSGRHCPVLTDNFVKVTANNHVNNVCHFLQCHHTFFSTLH